MKTQPSPWSNPDPSPERSPNSEEASPDPAAGSVLNPDFLINHLHTMRGAGLTAEEWSLNLRALVRNRTTRSRSGYVTEVDADAFVAWCLAGLPVCAREGDANEENWVPSMAEMSEAAEHVALSVSVYRLGGNVSAMARRHNASRRRIREQLKKHGLYQLCVRMRGDTEANP